MSREPAGKLRLDRSVRAIFQGKRPGARPARIVGYLKLATRPEGTPELALAIDGVIQLTVPAPRAAGWLPRIVALLPEALLDRVPEGLSAYLVEGDADQRRLRPLEIR